MHTLETLTFDNSFARLGTDFFTRVQPQPLSNPRLVHASQSAAQLLDLDVAALQQPDTLSLLQGEKIWHGTDPLAMVYSGHQFGYYNPQLGDGRGLLLGEVVNAAGQRWDLHLKGAGLTPYSRQGDGRAVLRSCIREYLASEALHQLGIPTSRALCLFSSETQVYRETVEPGAMLLRLSQSHIRIGSFEYFSYTQQHAQLKRLLDYSIASSYPELADTPNAYLDFLQHVIQRTAKLVAYWQAYGFTHGVLNTDNMSILGITFDYGPYGFMDHYQPSHVPNHSDHQGRYAFDQQPSIGLWNCMCLGQALAPLLDTNAISALYDEYEPTLRQHYYYLMQQKLGLVREHTDDQVLIAQLLQLLQSSTTDYTRFFRALSANDPQQVFDEVVPTHFAALTDWQVRYHARLSQESRPANLVQQHMQQHNPKYILRTHLAHQAIQQAYQGDFSEVARLHQILQNPFDEQPEFERYAAPAPDWSQQLTISCSS